MRKLFTMGKIVNTHGINGEVKIYPYTDDLNKFKNFEYLLIENEMDKKFELMTVRIHKNMVLAKFKNYNDINEVQALMNREIYIYRDEVSDDSDGHYIVDLLGSDIVLQENGEVVGKLKDVLQNTAQDIYEVERGSGDIFYIPVVDEFIKKIDTKNKRITVKLIEGMME